MRDVTKLWIVLLLAAPLAAPSVNGVSHHTGGDASPTQTQAVPHSDTKPSEIATKEQVERIARALETASNKGETDDEKRRAEQDLQAQNQMAKWAFWMFWIGFGDIALTAVGVYLIYRTLAYTRDTAVAAKDAVTEAQAATKVMQQQNKIAVQAQRPWLDYAVEIEWLDLSEREVSIQCKVLLKNIGQFAAENIRVSGVIFEANPNTFDIVEAAFANPVPHKDRNPDCSAILPQGHQEASINPTQKREIFEELARSGSLCPMLGVIVYYEWEGGAHSGVTCYSMYVTGELMFPKEASYGLKQAGLGIRPWVKARVY